MDIRLERIGATLVAKLDGELDHHTASYVRDTIDKEINLNKINNLILDFDKVSFMDSSGIGVIAGRYKIINSLGGKTMIIRANEQVDKILEISGLKKILEVNKAGGEI